VFRTRVMVGDLTAYLANAVADFAGGITALGSDGFTVGTSATVNTASDTYYWTAFGNAMRPDISGGSSDFIVGQYIGTGRDNVNVRGLPISPDFLAIKRNSTTAGAWRTANQSGDNSLFFAATAQTTNTIQSFRTDGFQIGTAANTNTSGSIYNYFGFATSSRFAINTYTGNGTSQNVTSVGFQPDHLWLKKTTGGTARGAMLRTSAQTGTAAQPFLNTPTLGSSITNLLLNGFALSTAVEVNESTGVFQYAAWDAKRYAQQVYRLFDNADSTDVGTALAAANTTATLASSGDAFRLRLLLRVDSGNLFSSGQNFKLQYAAKSGTCDTGFSGESYADVTGATDIAYNNNTPTDGVSLSANANDPTDGGRTIVNQTYEEANDFTNSQGAINNGQDGKWDFALIDNGAPADTGYCFRVVRSDGSQLESYAVIPEITTGSGASNSLPVASSVSIDSGAASVTLTEGTTKNVVCAGTVTDNDGFADIVSVEGSFFRTSVGTGGGPDDNNNYYLTGDSQCVPSGGSGNSETYTCTFPVQYFADATDAGSPNSADTWTCTMTPSDGVGTGTDASDTIEMSSLFALDVAASINYGTLSPNTDTGATNQTTTVTNTGNRDMDPQLSGTNMTSGGNNIAVGQQKYSSSSFTYSGGGTALSTTPTTLNLTLPQRTSTAVTANVSWGIGVPNGTPSGSYSGTNTFTATTGI